MKKAILSTFIISSIVAFSSCNKCKDCTCTQTVSQTGTPDITQVVEMTDLCDEDLEDVEGTSTFTQSVGGITQTIVQTCDCK